MNFTNILKGELNDLRVKVYNYLNSLKSFKENYYDFVRTIYMKL